MEPIPFFQIEQLERTKPFSMASNHFHDTYEFYYLLTGERFYYIHDRIYALQQGDLVFINKSELHRTTGKGRFNHERILVNFDDRFLQPLASLGLSVQPLFQGESFLLRPAAGEQEKLTGLLTAMLREEAEGRLSTRAYLQALLLQLLILLERMRREQPEPLPSEQSEQQRRVYGIISYLNAHYSAKLTLDRLAEHFYISATYLCRIFKQTTGFTVVEYLNFVRIREAQTLLKQTDWKITRIAEETGFDSIAHFGRVFKQITSRSPLQYRKQIRV
ncbi:helix-turn-helix transcriptional regulator [Paenibacillus donghaensis]|uniref:HTH araC/xylS-type domain-containing protein n=1 Tax=Paenibacillus donghaensis TaxID=414771 RepID=A0A2Z2KH37_9BACL|nr:AraC family transcriptional regulator [Paenibacillus donghaensis]ASA25187.1 hypothetical protein B9T62_33320 [Paenibacillus donghaensis]